jgi:Protein of unknown function (DUF2934)
MKKITDPKASPPNFQINENSSPEEQVAQRARELWHRRGCKPGDEWADWFQAEREVNEWHQRRQIKRGTTS